MSIVEETHTELRDLVLAALEGDEPDPRKIAENVAQMLPEQMLRQALAETLHHYVRVLGRVRATRTPGINESPKWAKAAELQEEVSILRLRVYARGEWKLLGDCDATDCLAMAQMRERHATLNAHKAKQFRTLAGALKLRKLSAVRDMPPDALTGIFDA